MTSQLLKRTTPLLAALLLAGCVSYSGIAPQSTQTSAADLALSNPTTQWPAAKSWEILHDPVLSNLIEQALEQSPTIKLANARLAQVAAMASAADSNRYPEASIGASVTPEHFTENGLYPPPYAGSVYSTNLLMVNARYEFDFWGKNHDLLVAAISQEKAAMAEVQSARLLIEASVAKSYYTLASNLAQKAIVEKILTQREELAHIAQQSLVAGLETSQDLKATEQAIPAVKASLSYLDEQISLSRNALAALIGKGPESTVTLVAHFPTDVVVSAPTSVPAELIGRRADISAARMRVEAAGKQIDAAKTEFYPNVNLSAFAGFSSLGFSHWLDGSSRDYGVGPAISLPIFDGGRLRANLSSKSAEYDMAVESYNQTLINAVHDVADNLTSLKAVGQQLQLQNELLRSAESVYQIAQQRQQAGLVNRMAVLSAQSSLLNQQSLAIVLQARSVDYNINLVRALGGGYNEQTAFQATTSNTH